VMISPADELMVRAFCNVIPRPHQRLKRRERCVYLFACTFY